MSRAGERSPVAALTALQCGSKAAGTGPDGIFERDPGMVTTRSSPATKVAFFRTLFAARRDIYATRWENTRTGKAGWVPAVVGGWRKGPGMARQYLPLTDEVITSHLSGEIHIGLYPLLDGDRCRWIAADFDGPAAILDALSLDPPPELS